MEGDKEETTKKMNGVVVEAKNKDDDEQISDKNNSSNNNNNNMSTKSSNHNDDDSSSQNSNSNNSNINHNYHRAAATTHHHHPPPPHWMAMQYPAPMVMPMPHPYMPPHYMPYGRQHHHAPPAPHSPGNGGGRSSNNGENRTIWVGDLQPWMDEDYLRTCFASSNGEVSSIKVIRNKQTGIPEGYGFIEFVSHAAAEKALQSYSHSVMPNTDQTFRLNWGMYSNGDHKRSHNNNNNVSGYSIFVGDLDADVTDSVLHETFATKYPSVKLANVVVDANTGRSKGYGFVRFGDDSERSQAMTDMQGVYCKSRPMRIGPATPRKYFGYQQQYSSQGGYENGASLQNSKSDGESANTTIFVGGLSPNVSDEDLKQPFASYGEIVSVKIPVGKGCGFVQFANRNDAEEALQQLSGLTLGKQTVRLAWGRNPAHRQSYNDFGQQWTGPYYGYGYPMHHYPQDPYMYAGYGAYPYYGTYQQVN